MNRLNLFVIIAMAGTILSSCDEGRLYDVVTEQQQEGFAAKLTVTVRNHDSWPDGYTLALAGFAGNGEYAMISKNLDLKTDNGVCNMTLTGIPKSVTSVELCAIDRLRRRVASFLAVDCSETVDTIYVDSYNTIIDVSMANAIQREIFNTTCAQCHGGTGFAAAGLNLTEGKSFVSMVSVPSVKRTGMNRVEPGQSASSILYRILSTEESASWSYDHSVEVVRQERLELIKNWIDAGAGY